MRWLVDDFPQFNRPMLHTSFNNPYRTKMYFRYVNIVCQSATLKRLDSAMFLMQLAYTIICGDTTTSSSVRRSDGWA